MKIAIAVPPSAVSRSGNWHTATRWSAFLRSLGHRVRVASRWDGGDDDLLLALHAYKSYPAIAQFSRRRPGAPVVLALTGTDIYRDVRKYATAKRALALASRLIVLQKSALQELSPVLRRKVRIVYQSSDVRLPHKRARGRFRIAVIGHLRGEKDPFRAARALHRIDNAAPVELFQIGGALSQTMKRAALAWEERDTRYHWLGSLSHDRAMRCLASSHVLVVSSVMEGGANVICEAARIGVPVLASRIPGNVGMLGRDYPGYFRLFDDRALARLIERCRKDTSFYGRLRRALLRRRDRFAPRAERAALAAALRGLPISRQPGRTRADRDR